MHSFIQPVASQFSALADQQKAVFMKVYMKNKFEFIGIQTPERRKICKDYMKQHKPKDEKELEIIVKELWMQPEREFQYFAIELLPYNKRLWQPAIIQLFEYCVTNKSWWDTVDFIATECTGRYFKTFLTKLYLLPVAGIIHQICGCNEAVCCFKKAISTIQIPNCFPPIFLMFLLQKNFLYKKQ